MCTVLLCLRTAAGVLSCTTSEGERVASSSPLPDLALVVPTPSCALPQWGALMVVDRAPCHSCASGRCMGVLPKISSSSPFARSFFRAHRLVDVVVGDTYGCKSPSLRRLGQLPVYWVPWNTVGSGPRSGPLSPRGETLRHISMNLTICFPKALVRRGSVTTLLCTHVWSCLSLIVHAKVNPAAVAQA